MKFPIHQTQGMLKLIEDLEGIIELSDREREDVIDAVRRFVINNFHPSPDLLHQSFQVPHKAVLNQQEDEDNSHSLLAMYQ